MSYAEYEKVASSVDRFGAAQSPQVSGQLLKLTGLDKGKSNDLAWAKLDPIPEATDDAPDVFPFAALGPILGNAAKAISQDVQAPDSLAAGSVLAAASLAVQALANVFMPHGSRSPLSVYVITGAGSGDRKTGVDAVACKEIEAVRQQQARTLTKDLERYAADMREREKNDSEITRPTPKSLTTSNATIEGISKLLKNQSHVGVFSAEGGEMLSGYSMRGEQRSAALAFYLKGWSGESIDSLRSGDGLSVLLSRRIAMHVLVQPVLLGQLLSDPLAQGQGLLARCLIAQPETLAGYRPYRDCNPNENPDVIAFNSVIEGLLATTLPLRQDGDGYELEPRDLHLSDAAKELWVAFYNEIELQQASGKELDGARPFASKAAEHAARIAGIITLCENPHATLIDYDAMDGGIQVTGFYLTEHIRLIGAGHDERHHDKLRTLQAWMQAQGSRVSKKDLLQKSPRQIRNLKAAGISLLLEELVRRGYLHEHESEWEVRHV
jgi:putative DNA primase/helicase